MEFLPQAPQVINSLVRPRHKLNSHRVDIQVAVDGTNLHHHQQQQIKEEDTLLMNNLRQVLDSKEVNKDHLMDQAVEMVMVVHHQVVGMADLTVLEVVDKNVIAVEDMIPAAGVVLTKVVEDHLMIVVEISSSKRIQYLFLACLQTLLKLILNNILVQLALSRLIKKLESPKFGCTMINQLEDLKVKQLLHMMMLILLIVLYPGLMVNHSMDLQLMSN